MFRTRYRLRAAFTLIELLVVIAIIAILVGLLLPAIQRVRESANKTTCSNNLKQLALACMSFHDRAGWMPTAGSADSGNPATDRRDFGWTYEILPDIEQAALYEIPSDSSYPPQVNGPNDDKLRHAVVKSYYCPTRRSPGLYRGGWAKSDYAGNGGNQANVGDNWINGAIVRSPGSKTTYVGGHIKLTAISNEDGASNTMLLGEKAFNTNGGSNDYVDNESWAGPGTDGDIMRGASADTVNKWCVPILDQDWGVSLPAPPNGPANGMDVWMNFRFGSAHRTGINSVFVDGSVRTIRFEVDPDVFMRACVRNDGLPFNPDGL